MCYHEATTPLFLQLDQHRTKKVVLIVMPRPPPPKAYSRAFKGSMLEPPEKRLHNIPTGFVIQTDQINHILCFPRLRKRTSLSLSLSVALIACIALYTVCERETFDFPNPPGQTRKREAPFSIVGLRRSLPLFVLPIHPRNSKAGENTHTHGRDGYYRRNAFLFPA